MDRRLAIKTMLAGGVSMLACEHGAGGTTSLPTQTNANFTFVLVHGTSCGSWVWHQVAPLLWRLGHRVFTPTLTGMAERAHAGGRIDFESHVQDIVDTLEYEDLSSVVLVGHSYGGMVITGAAARAPERLARLIYLDAYVPLPGETSMDLWPPGEKEKAEEAIRHGQTSRPTPPVKLFGVTDPTLIEWIEKRFTPQPFTTYSQPVPSGTAATAALARSFVLGTRGPSPRAFGPSADRIRKTGGAVREVDAGHFMMLTHAQQIAALLVELAT